MLVVEPGVPRIFDTNDLIELSGAFADSELIVKYNKMAIILEVKHHAVREMVRELFFDLDKNCWVIHNTDFRIHPSFFGHNLAARSIAIQANAARRVGAGRITTLGVGNFRTARYPELSQQWVGYWIWPRLGFDADIPAAIKHFLSANLQGCCRISDLIATPDGMHEWLVHGGEVSLEFDLAEGSKSWAVLDCYTAERNIRV